MTKCEAVAAFVVRGITTPFRPRDGKPRWRARSVFRAKRCRGG